MALPFFYAEEINAGSTQFVLNEETSKHVVQVLRMQNGEQLRLTDGKGNLYIAVITGNNRKKCSVAIRSSSAQPASGRKITVAISLVKNNTRFEWFLEKATEIGVSEIIPLICNRTEKQHSRQERMKSILISAMLQSQQTWLPLLAEPTRLSAFINIKNSSKKFIAHCEDGESKIELLSFQPFGDTTILIGPEGDFTSEEIRQAIANDFTPVSLGNTRLRTETAGIVAATLLCVC